MHVYVYVLLIIDGATSPKHATMLSYNHCAYKGKVVYMEYIEHSQVCLYVLLIITVDSCKLFLCHMDSVLTHILDHACMCNECANH